ncbi:glutathione S-transferase family protein [Variovorax terrae]|uniref:Glutathione S-transferase family protein n=1 Tax=Variovorax terrae TaxID=2923278 RepID=A0A9X1VZ98_9BURK|nr:glutathione S-transferase family protein [Variovorax terrae]MCJ0764909.1 glutathione S-transferase family protein [Variovorax terrae]
MLTLYHCENARSFRVLWMLEELGLSYDLKILPFPPRVLCPQYLEVNPLGTVPLLVEDGMRMSESAAICQYLASRYAPNSLGVESHEADYGAYLNGLHFGEASLTFPQTLILRYEMLEPEERRLPQASRDYALFFLGRLRELARLLGSRDFICANRFTAADVSIGYALMLAGIVGQDGRFTPAIQEYWGRLRERAAFKRAVAIQDKKTT